MPLLSLVLRRIEISSSSNKVSLYLGTRDGSDTTRDGQECFKLHVVGPRVRTKPAYAEIIDYYQPQVKDTQMYTIPEDCPPRIAHDDSSNYLPSDNLFSKAKSLIDSDEIVISYEYTPEELPEGIPLEDPIYDNLKKMKKNIDVKRLIKGDELSETSQPSELQIKFGNIIDYRTLVDEKIIAKASSNNATINQIGIGKLDTSHQNTMNVEKQLNQLKSENEINKKIKHYIKIRDESMEMNKNEKNNEDQNKVLHKSESKLSVDNPILSTFHVIDSDQDLQVPTGIEGPVPAVVLPPPDFLARHMGLAAPSYYKWAENPALSFSPQYLRENYYRRNYLYDAATSRK